jgi:signal peptide peptidase SppA
MVIPIYGVIMPRANLMTEYSGGATVAGIRTAFREALADESVGSILFDVDSPGGYTDGIEELASEIREARGRKPMLAIANYSMASAALYLGAQADEVSASPSAQVGWIGTVMVHQEASRALEEEGITTTIFRNPPGKFGGNQYEPLSEKARDDLQGVIDELSSQFHSAVATARGVPVGKVRSDFGQGGGMSAAKAKAAGLIDRVETFDQALTRLGSGRVRAGARATAAQGAPWAIVPDEAAPVAADLPAPPDAAVQAAAALALARAQAAR